MEYRQLPHGLPQEKFSVLGIGMGGIQNSSPAEIETVVRKALDHGINFFDLGAGGANVYAPSAGPSPADGTRCFSNCISARCITTRANTAGAGTWQKFSRPSIGN